MSEAANGWAAPSLPPFPLSAVVYLDQPAGHEVTNLAELLERVSTVDAETLFMHTQMPRLRHPAGDDLPVDDFSGWVRGVVQDVATAERLAFAVQAAESDVEHVRSAIVGVLEALPVRTRTERAAPPDGALELLRFDAVEVPTGLEAHDPEELMDMLARSDRTTWFHHLIEQDWFRPGPAPIIEWTRAAGAHRLAELLEREGTSGRSVEQIRARALGRWRRSRFGTRVTEADRNDTDERRAQTREAAGKLARRLARKAQP